ncbi:MAG: TPM domain-containing protein [Candidatus Aminicenantes bacterium]|nr:TPM domain-containing protein [Candidatus Aminicenantes bacterium]
MSHKARYQPWIPALLLAVIFATALWSEKVEEVINPRQASGGYVSDGGGVLGPEYISLIDGVCRDLQSKTTIELAVVTVGDLGGLVIEDFAEKLFRRFAIGAAGKDNGLLLLYSRDDRAVRLEVGYGLEATIPDAKASRILDRSAIPFCRRGEIGRGLFLCARELTETAAAGALVIPEPAAWPEQVTPPVPLPRNKTVEKKGWDPLTWALLFGAALLAFAGLGLLRTLVRWKRARALAARRRAAAGGVAFTVIAWIASFVGFIVLMNTRGQFLPTLLAALAAPGLGTAGQVLTGRFLKRRLASYRLPCAACGAAMAMVPDCDDEKFLDAEEAAEERAGGMDYEFWHCPQCGADEKLAVKLGQAAKCPQCKRRTLKSSSTTLVAATREHGGRVRVTEACINPNCDYNKTREHGTARLSSPRSSSGSSSSSRSGSFGGGRSGGGGASKHF